jgi:hypothetical protein
MSLFDSVKSLNLPVGDFAIFGSGPLIVRGIIPASNDLDIICRGQAWERVKAIGELEYLSKYDVTVVTMCGGRLTFGTKWAIGEFDIDELIDGAEEIDGLPFVRLEHVTNFGSNRGLIVIHDNSYSFMTWKGLRSAADSGVPK